jgi:hypothetical protein
LILPAGRNIRNRIRNFEVLYSAFKTTAYNSLLVQISNKFINTDLKVELNNFTNTLLLSTFYYTGNNTDSVSGLFTASVDAVSNTAASNFNAFGNNILSQLNKKYGRGVEGKNIEVRNIIPQNNGGFIITAEVTLGIVFGNPGQNSRNIITNPRVQYDPGFQPNINYPNKGAYPAGGNFPDPANAGRTGSSSFGNLLYDDIIIAYFNDSMKLNTSFVVPKKQAYKYLSADKLSYLTLNNGKQINVLFNAGSVRNNLIYNKSFSAAGESAVRPTLKIKDDRNILMPGNSKQVALNQALLAFSYRGKLRFGRFDF